MMDKKGDSIEENISKERNLITSQLFLDLLKQIFIKQKVADIFECSIYYPKFFSVDFNNLCNAKSKYFYLDSTEPIELNQIFIDLKDKKLNIKERKFSPSVMNYFIESTFPALFGFFISSEMTLAAVTFINSIEPSLHEKFYGSMIRHCPRLYVEFEESALILLSDEDDSLSPSIIFIESMKSAISILPNMIALFIYSAVKSYLQFLWSEVAKPLLQYCEGSDLIRGLTIDEQEFKEKFDLKQDKISSLPLIASTSLNKIIPCPSLVVSEYDKELALAFVYNRQISSEIPLMSEKTIKLYTNCHFLDQLNLFSGSLNVDEEPVPIEYEKLKRINKAASKYLSNIISRSVTNYSCQNPLSSFINLIQQIVPINPKFIHECIKKMLGCSKIAQKIITQMQEENPMDLSLLPNKLELSIQITIARKLVKEVFIAGANHINVSSDEVKYRPPKESQGKNELVKIDEFLLKKISNPELKLGSIMRIMLFLAKECEAAREALMYEEFVSSLLSVSDEIQMEGVRKALRAMIEYGDDFFNYQMIAFLFDDIGFKTKTLMQTINISKFYEE